MRGKRIMTFLAVFLLLPGCSAPHIPEIDPLELWPAQSGEMIDFLQGFASGNGEYTVLDAEGADITERFRRETAEAFQSEDWLTVRHLCRADGLEIQRDITNSREPGPPVAGLWLYKVARREIYRTLTENGEPVGEALYQLHRDFYYDPNTFKAYAGYYSSMASLQWGWLDTDDAPMFTKRSMFLHVVGSTYNLYHGVEYRDRWNVEVRTNKDKDGLSAEEWRAFDSIELSMVSDAYYPE